MNAYILVMVLELVNYPLSIVQELPTLEDCKRIGKQIETEYSARLFQAVRYNQCILKEKTK